MLAHREAHEAFVGPIPEGLCVLHRCDNPPCCNPDHLFLGTRADNNADMVAKGRSAAGERNGWAKLSDADVRWIFWAMAYAGASHSALAKAFNVSRSAIGNLSMRARRRVEREQAREGERVA